MKVIELKNLDWLTVEQAAQMIQVSPSKVRTAINQGKIKVFRDGRVIRINREELNHYIKERTK